MFQGPPLHAHGGRSTFVVDVVDAYRGILEAHEIFQDNWRQHTQRNRVGNNRQEIFNLADNKVMEMATTHGISLLFHTTFANDLFVVLALNISKPILSIVFITEMQTLVVDFGSWNPTLTVQRNISQSIGENQVSATRWDEVSSNENRCFLETNQLNIERYIWNQLQGRHPYLVILDSCNLCIAIKYGM